MAKKIFTENNLNTNIPAEDFLERQRLHALLKKAMNYPLVIICAGSGYGKTRAVSSFLKDYNAVAPWIQLSERDNIPVRFWESICKMSLMVSEEYSTRLNEIGFPKTEDEFSKFSDTVKHYISSYSGKVVGVFDDFHLLNNPEILKFFEFLINVCPSNLSIILISRCMPDINIVNLNMRGKVFTIQEDMLMFTEDEIAKYFSQLNLSVTNVDIRYVFDDTQGWALAINLIGRSLYKKHKYERYALEAMKKNIYKLIETEILQTVSQPLKHFLLRISLLDRLPSSLIKSLANDDKLIGEMEHFSTYIRYDYNMDSYMIHHMLRDYLRLEQEKILTDTERKEIHEAKAAWCDENGYPMDAFLYYEKAENYDAIIQKVAAYNLQMPRDMAKFILDVFERILKKTKPDNPTFPSMHIRLKTNLGQYEDAIALAFQYINDYEKQPDTPERNRTLTTVYASLTMLRMYMCTYTDEYDFDVYAGKAREYYDKNPFKFFGTYRLSPAAWSSLVGTESEGAMEKYIEAVSRMTPHLIHTMNGFYSGMEELLRGELFFYRRQLNDAEQNLKKSILKASEFDQYVTHNRALVYLMYIDFSRGDFEGAETRLKEMKALLNEKDHGVRYTIYDIACGYFYLKLDLPERIPEWLKGDFTSFTHSSFIENYANRVRLRYHYYTRRFNAILAYIDNARNHPMILYGKIELLILRALSLYQLKKRNEAIEAFTEAYKLSEPNGIITSFTEHAKDMRTLTLAINRAYGKLNGSTGNFKIPKKWLEEINRISSTYAKRKTRMIADFKAANNIENDIKLTRREISILKDMAEGLSRSEIASNRNLSINTIKMAISIIYGKMGVSSLGEAVRIAVDKKII